MDKQKLLIAGAVGLAIALLTNQAAASTTDRAAGSETDMAPDSTSTGKPSSTGAGAGSGSTGFPLKRGSKGEKVRKLQQWLGVGADSIFGPVTETALKKRAGRTQIATQAEYDALLKGVSVANQTQPATSTQSVNALAASLYTACYATKNVPVFAPTSPGKAPQQVGTSSLASFRAEPDYSTIKRVLASRSDADLKRIGGAWWGQYGTLTGGAFSHTLRHWNETALKLYGLYSIQAKLISLGL